jgi:hypothetical protein
MASNRWCPKWWGRDDSVGNDRDVESWQIGEIERLWREACEGCGLCQWISTASGWTVAIPTIGRVTLGNPTSMTVQLRPGQLPEHINKVAPEIAYAMGLGDLRVTAFWPMWVRVELLDFAEAAGAAGAANGVPPLRPTHRTGPSTVWTHRKHPRSTRRPEQPR